MEEIKFYIQGSTDEPYEVVFKRRTNTNLSAYCNCRAGTNGMHCKHRLSIFDGSTKEVVSDNIEQVKTVQSWLLGTDLEAALNEMKQIESTLNQVKKELAAAKKEVAKAMLD